VGRLLAAVLELQQGRRRVQHVGNEPRMTCRQYANQKPGRAQVLGEGPEEGTEHRCSHAGPMCILGMAGTPRIGFRYMGRVGLGPRAGARVLQLMKRSKFSLTSALSWPVRSLSSRRRLLTPARSSTRLVSCAAPGRVGPRAEGRSRGRDTRLLPRRVWA